MRPVYICKNCSKEYSPRKSRWATFCSLACNFDFRKKKKESSDAKRKAEKEGRIKLRECIGCGIVFKPSLAQVRKKYCSENCRILAHEKKKEKPAGCLFCGKALKFKNQKFCSHSCYNLVRRRAKVERACVECGKLFYATKRAMYCSKTCRNRVKKRNESFSVRAKIHNSEIITIAALGKRDGWSCKICGKKINPQAEMVYPGGASIDHIIPLAKGGEHSWSNVQLAHIGCNSHKRDTTDKSYQLYLNIDPRKL